MNNKRWSIISKIRLNFTVMLVELFILAAMCFGLLNGKLPFVEGQEYHTFGEVLLCVIVVLVIIGSYYSIQIVVKCLKKPLEELVESSEKVANGSVSVDLKKFHDDEIGDVIDEYKKIVENTREKADVAKRIADGDIAQDVIPHSSEDVLGMALKELVDNNNRVLVSIKESSFQLSAGADQVASASQALAQGSTQQASAIEQITASMNDIAKKTNENASQATIGDKVVREVQTAAVASNEDMSEMINAMNNINASSHNISKVIKVIDDIAFQTNILALNATVEAARAGVHGKGFAVVAEEVKNLAEKSAAAANETAEMIQSSIDKVEEGVKIADNTAKSLEKIVEALGNVVEIIGGIATLSNEQATAVAQIDQAISQVSQVIQTNSATSEECASASEELANQSQALRDMIAHYNLKETSYRNPSYMEKPSYTKQSYMPTRKSINNEKIISLDGDFGKY
jgi:methyl-accepting chemotaxis protein